MSVTVAAGSDAALVFTFPGGDITDAEITITPSVGSPVVGPTGVGIGAAGSGVYTYIWQTTTATAAGTYTATIDGVDGDPVEQSVTVYVTSGVVYATLDDLKLSLASNTAALSNRDDLLNRALLGASRGIDGFTSRRFWLDETASARTLKPRGRVVRHREGDVLLTADIGSLDDLVIEIGSPTTSWTAVTLYETHPDEALVDGRPVTGLLADFGTWAPRIRVTALWGWPSVPDAIVQATLIQAARLYRRKDSPEGVAGSAEWGLMRVPNLDPDVRALCAPFVLPGLG